MTVWYVDTSAAVKFLLDEPESAALANAVDRADITLAGCWLVETELRRIAHRVPTVSQSMVTDLLDELEMYEMPVSLYREAGLLPGPSPRSHDALHIAAAGRIGVDAICTYDDRMAEAARAVGLLVHAPA